MIKNIIFDFNGTLVDDVDVSLDALNACCDKFLGPNHRLSKEYYLDTFAFPVRPYYKSIGFDIDDMNYDDLANFFIKHYTEHASGCKLYNDVISTLDRLKKEGYNLYLLSASYKSLLTDQLAFYKINSYFNDIIALENKYANGKVEIAKQFMSKSKINPYETIMIGDTIHDSEVAEEINVTPILCCNGHNSYKFLSTTKYKIINSLSEIFDII